MMHLDLDSSTRTSDTADRAQTDIDALTSATISHISTVVSNEAQKEHSKDCLYCLDEPSLPDMSYCSDDCKISHTYELNIRSKQYKKK